MRVYDVRWRVIKRIFKIKVKVFHFEDARKTSFVSFSQQSTLRASHLKYAIGKWEKKSWSVKESPYQILFDIEWIKKTFSMPMISWESFVSAIDFCDISVGLNCCRQETFLRDNHTKPFRTNWRLMKIPPKGSFLSLPDWIKFTLCILFGSSTCFSLSIPFIFRYRSWKGVFRWQEGEINAKLVAKVI